ncbi:MAG: flagellar biosynthetic protein FliQ [Nannocystaceae bacterium]|nr:flagellar biosynthetic protein FliQ [Nannocystaceae bacterium]
MTELFDIVRDMLMVAVTVLLPLLLAGVAGAVIGGLVVVWLGLQDQGLATMIRGVCVLAALAFTGAAAFEGAVEETASAWAYVEGLGRDGVALDLDGS